jgi:hypothetical protein
VQYLGQSLRKLHADVSNRPSIDDLYNDMLKLHLLLRQNPKGVGAVDLDHLHNFLAATTTIQLALVPFGDDSVPAIKSPRMPQALADTFRGMTREQLVRDAVSTRVVQATLEQQRSKWTREIESAKNIFTQASQDSGKALHDSLNSSTVGLCTSLPFELSVALFSARVSLMSFPFHRR